MLTKLIHWFSAEHRLMSMYNVVIRLRVCSVQCALRSAVIELIHRDPGGRTQLQEVSTQYQSLLS